MADGTTTDFSSLGSLKEGSQLMASKRSQLQEDAYFRVLRLLQDNPEMSQRELAKVVGVSVGSMHYVLSALVDKGLVKLDNFASAKDKRRYSYMLTPRGIAEKAKITKRFLARKREEYEALRAEIEELESDLEDDVYSKKVISKGH